MKAKKKLKDVDLLTRALKVAAVEAYHHEIIDTDMFHNTIGTNKEFPTVTDWLKDRMNKWIEEAELQT